VQLVESRLDTFSGICKAEGWSGYKPKADKMSKTQATHRGNARAKRWTLDTHGERGARAYNGGLE